MRYKTRERSRTVMRTILGIFLGPLLTSIPIITGIWYVHTEWWDAIPIMSYSTAYWGQVLLGVISVPIFFLSAAVWALLD